MTDTADDVREWAHRYPREFGLLVDELGFRYSNLEMKVRLEAEYEMNRRDQFAMYALGGLLAAAESSENWSWRTGTLTGDAYMFADEMLDARKVK